MPLELAEEIVAPEAPISVRASLEAGFAAAEAAPAPVTEIKPATIPEPKADAPKAPVVDAAQVARDEAGRFAAKTNDAPTADLKSADAPKTDTKITDTPAAAPTEAPQEPIPAPAALSAVAKSQWATLPPVIQAEWAKRERDMDAGLQKQAVQLKRFERIDEAIAPHRNYLAINGLTDESYLRSLIAADGMLRGPNPGDALAQIAGMYNIDLRQTGQPGQQPQQAQQPQPQAQPDPRYQELVQTVASLQQTVAQQQSAAQESVNTQRQSQIDNFAKDHLYFENVRQQMGALLRSPGLAELAETSPLDAMKSAYDQACWAHPEIRPLLLAEQTATQEAAARAAVSAKANEARQASGSVTGSPTPGTGPVRTGPAPAIRASLEQGFAAALN
jgi:hypothetical protein